MAMNMKGSLRIYAVRMRRYALLLFQYLFLEKTRGLDFTMRKLTDADEKAHWYHGYSKTSEKHLRAIFSQLSYDQCRNFLDIGCGKGVVLKEAVKYPFQKVAGIELLPELVDTAHENFKKLKLEEKISCIQANAMEYENYGSFDTFFLFNPFGPEVLEKVAQKLEEAIHTSHRAITVIYHNPQYLHVFENMPGYQFQKELYDPLKEYRTCIFQIQPQESGKACV